MLELGGYTDDTQHGISMSILRHTSRGVVEKGKHVALPHYVGPKLIYNVYEEQRQAESGWLTRCGL